jgi:Protein of unknown function (DUF3293)
MIPEDPWIAYARTIVEVSPPARATFRILPAPKGEVGNWPAGFEAEIFVITAWNPHSQPLDDNENRLRQAALESELAQLELWAAVGLDPDSDYREEGVAVSGLSEMEAITLGARYDQNAIFRWTPVAWSILSCLDKRREDWGWLVYEPSN